MPSNSNLMRYIGMKYDDDTQSQIENEFSPYKVMICDERYFHCEMYFQNAIRCVLHNGTIAKLQFN